MQILGPKSGSVKYNIGNKIMARMRRLFLAAEDGQRRAAVGWVDRDLSFVMAGLVPAIPIGRAVRP
jgi:hypothetical protein